MSSPWDGPQRPRRERFFNLPPVVTWTSATLLVLYFLFMLQSQAAQQQLLWDFAFIPARFGTLPPDLAGLPHSSALWGVLTMVTHTGLHGSLMHVGFNVAWLMAFGTVAARVTGTRGFFIIYVAGAVAGALVFYWFHPGDVVPVVGASGAISALMGAGVRMLYGPGLARLTDARVLTFTVIWLAVNLVFGLGGFQVGGQTGQIAWEAHMGGYFAGLLIVPWLIRYRRGA
jgi:membrane associated rhomboid family serine protease